MRDLRGWRPLLLLLLISLLADLGTAFAYPVLPLYLRQLSLSVLFIGALEAAGEAGLGLLQLYSGWLADRLRRQVVFIRAGLLTAGLGLGLLALASRPAGLFAARVLRSAGDGLMSAPLYARLSCEVERQRTGWAFGLNKAAEKVGVTLGMLLAIAYLHAEPGDYASLFALGTLPMLLAWGVALRLRDVRREVLATLPKPPARPLAYWRAQPAGLRRVFGLAALYSLFRSTDVLLILRGRDIGSSDLHLLWAYLLFQVVLSLAAVPAGRLTDRLGPRRTFLIGLLAFVLLYGAMGSAGKPAWLWGLFALHGIHVAFTWTVLRTWVSRLCPAGERGTALGLLGGIRSVLLIAANLLAGGLWFYAGPHWAFWTSAAGGLVLLGLLRSWRSGDADQLPAADATQS